MRWVGLGLLAVTLAGCGSSESAEPPTELRAEPEPEGAPDEGEPEAEPAAPECAAGAVVDLGPRPDRGLWDVAYAPTGYALARCDESEHAVVQLLDEAGAPRGEARTFEELPCRRTAPRIAAVGERYVVTSHGRCGRARMSRCFHHLALDEMGAALGEPVTVRRTFLQGNDRAVVATTSTSVFMTESEWARGDEVPFSIDERIDVASDGSVAHVDHDGLGWSDGCWTGECVASEGDRVVAVLETDDREQYGRRGGLRLWRSWEEEAVTVRPLPWRIFEGERLRLVGDAAWITFTHNDPPVARLGRIDVETGRVTSWADQLAPGPPVPDFYEPARQVADEEHAVVWHDVFGRPVADPVPVSGTIDRVVGDAQRALAVRAGEDGLEAVAVRCSRPFAGAREAVEPAGEIAARGRPGRWATALAFSEGSVLLGSGDSLRCASFSPPATLASCNGRTLGRVAAPLRAVSLQGNAWAALGGDSELSLHGGTRRRAATLSVPSAVSMARDGRHVYLGAEGRVVRVPSAPNGLAIDRTVEVEGTAVDLTIADGTLYAALASGDAGAVVAIDLRGGFRETGRVSLDAPAVAIDSDRQGVVVATRSGVHRLEASDDGLESAARAAALELHDVAVTGGRAFTVDANGAVREHALGGTGTDRELAPDQEAAPEGRPWRLRATRELVVRGGPDVAVIPLSTPEPPAEADPEP